MADDLKKEIDAMSGEKPAARFVRTFDTDQAALKAGETPDFTESRQSEEGSALFEESRSGSIPREVSETRPAERLVQGSAVDAPAPILPINAPTPAPLSRPAPPVVEPLHTYRGDFEGRVDSTNASTASILAAEQDAKRPEPVPAPVKKNNLPYILAGSALVILGIGGAFAAFLYESRNAPVALPNQIQAPILVNESEELHGEGSALTEAVRQSNTRLMNAGAIRLLYETDATSTNNVVFLSLDLPAPDVLLRNITPGGMAGIVNATGGQSPFFLISVSSYGPSFAGMLDWEPTMPKDLAGLYPAYPASDTASSTPRVFPAPALTYGFRDEVVANHDTRVYKDAAGRSVLIYGYVNPTTILLARDEQAFAAILDRLATSHTQS